MHHCISRKFARILGHVGIAATLVVGGCSGDSPPERERGEVSSSITRGPDAMSFNQGWRVDLHVRAVRDLNGDGRADLVGFGNEGVWLADNQNNSFAVPALAVSGLGNNQGFDNTNSIRTLADVNGDGRLDLVAIGQSAVMVSLKSAGAGYSAPTVWSTDYTAAAGWRVGQQVLTLADVDADGRADLVGIDSWGVYVARALPGGGFEPKRLWLHAFIAAEGWDISKHPRLAIDINNDGRADIVGFGNDGVWASLSTGTEFGPRNRVSADFGANDGWLLDHTRVFANVDGDRLIDIVGIGVNGVMVAHGGAGGTFGAATRWINDFGTGNGWDAAKHPRLVADVDDDGMADIVGIKDDAVVLARSTGTAFATPEAVLADFTFNKGWRVTTHPRFLADVDGDGELDLVGFFNDAVYWDRLTPTQPPLPPNWETPACSASRLGQPAPRTCEGPWSYTQIQRCVGVDPACPQYCSDVKACPLWENGAVPSSVILEAPPTPITGPDTRLCTQVCRRTPCPDGESGECVTCPSAPKCPGIITPPTAACQAAANTRKSALAAQVFASVMVESNFDSAATQSQRAAVARDLVNVTPRFFVQQSPNDVQPGPSGTVIRTWIEQYRCGLDVVTAAPVTADNAACGCDAFSSSSCEHDCGTTTKYTDPGKERPTSPYISGQICMTHDDLPQATPSEVQAKFDALWQTYQGTPAPTVAADTFKRAIVTRLKLMYELFADQLVDQHNAHDQIHRAISLYKGRPDDNPACALDIDSPAIPAGCTNPAVAGTRGDLIRCQRLLGTHAAEAAASLASTDCTALLTGYLDLKAQTADDATCGGPHLRQVGASTVFKLFDKQLGVINSAPTTLGSLARQLWLLDSWYAVSKKAEAAGVFPAPDQQRRDTSFLLGELSNHVRGNTSADAQLTAASHASTTEDAEVALGLSAAASRAGEQSVVNALFTVPPTIQPENVTLTRPPLRSLPLLALLGDALKPLIDDLNGLALYHDIACQFRDCRAPDTDTPSRSAWKLLSELEASTLANDVTAGHHSLAGWKTSLGKLAAQQATFRQAVSDAVTGAGGLAGATAEADVQPLARPLWLLYKHARAFHDHYETTGLFEPAAPNQLHGSMLSEDQHQVANELRARVTALDTSVNEYRRDLIAALQSEITVMANGATLQNLTARRLHKAEEMNQKSKNLEGLRAAGEDEDDAFGSLTASFLDIQHALDAGAFVQVGNTTTLTLTGRSGKFTGSESLANLAVHTIPNLARGQMVVVQASSTWTPTCSLSEVKFLGAGGDNPLAAANLADAQIGPEGYTVTSSGGTFEAHASGHAFGAEAAIGHSSTLCATLKVPPVFGLEASAIG
jgi:hypothetical protein